MDLALTAACPALLNAGGWLPEHAPNFQPAPPGFTSASQRTGPTPLPAPASSSAGPPAMARSQPAPRWMVALPTARTRGETGRAPGAGWPDDGTCPQAPSRPQWRRFCGPASRAPPPGAAVLRRRRHFLSSRTGGCRVAAAVGSGPFRFRRPPPAWRAEISPGRQRLPPAGARRAAEQRRARIFRLRRPRFEAYLAERLRHRLPWLPPSSHALLCGPPSPTRRYPACPCQDARPTVRHFQSMASTTAVWLA